jgi:hypothetical protein
VCDIFTWLLPSVWGRREYRLAVYSPLGVAAAAVRLSLMWNLLFVFFAESA